MHRFQCHTLQVQITCEFEKGRRILIHKGKIFRGRDQIGVFLCAAACHRGEGNIKREAVFCICKVFDLDPAVGTIGKKQYVVVKPGVLLAACLAQRAAVGGASRTGRDEHRMLYISRGVCCGGLFGPEHIEPVRRAACIAKLGFVDPVYQQPPAGSPHICAQMGDRSIQPCLLFRLHYKELIFRKGALEDQGRFFRLIGILSEMQGHIIGGILKNGERRCKPHDIADVVLQHGLRDRNTILGHHIIEPHRVANTTVAVEVRHPQNM